MEGSAPTVRILIADDHPIFRDGLHELLKAEPGFDVVGEAGDGEAAVGLAHKLRPDILLLDLAMPRRSGLEALRALSESSSEVRTIVLSAAIDNSQVVEALQLGARGIVLKESATQLLLQSIRSVMAGQYWIGHESVSNLVQVLRSRLAGAAKDARRRNFSLTPNELKIVATIVAGYSNSEISKQFKISERTVKHHLTNIFDKVGVSSRLELALFAVNHHLVDEE